MSITRERAKRVLRPYWKDESVDSDSFSWIANVEVLDFEIVNGFVVALICETWNYQQGEPAERRAVLCECHAHLAGSQCFEDSRKVQECTRRELYRAKVRERIYSEHSDRWADMPLKEQVMDVWRLFQSGIYLGELHAGKLLYVQEVAKLLCVSPRKVLFAVDELFAEDRLDLNGMILTEYINRFRFPREMQSMIQYMIESPIGWPSGDAGAGFVLDMERRIQEVTGYDHGKDVFGEDYPHLSLGSLFEVGFYCLFGSRMSRALLLEQDYLSPGEIRSLASAIPFLEKLLAQLANILNEFDEQRVSASVDRISATRLLADWNADRKNAESFYYPYEIRKLLHRITNIKAVGWIDTVWKPEGETSSFWAHNHPCVSDETLLLFGQMWLKEAVNLLWALAQSNEPKENEFAAEFVAQYHLQSFSSYIQKWIAKAQKFTEAQEGK